ncbi:MAG: serine/threonine protein kinase [Spirochaetaceae bacterium]|nr:MAG: serine/threonine protein kinase [Spirochaetaceae bacterium]
MRVGLFDLLTPDAVITAVERCLDLILDGSVQPYPSYVNRVYGLRDDENRDLIVKFYRPGRWTQAAIAEEHQFLSDCAAAEIPVVTPLCDAQGHTLHTVAVEDSGDPQQPDAPRRDSQTFFFALFPKRGGRNFDAETDQQWHRLGSLIGRCHAVGLQRRAPHRLICTPRSLTRDFVDHLLSEGVVVPQARDEFQQICGDTLQLIEPRFDDVALIRIHGDCHRGNILDRPDSGLVLFDFDDMMSGPAVQDLWLLLPDYAQHSTRELTLLLDGYQQFTAFDRSTLALIEPLRFMRMIYFLAWRASQMHDHWFRRALPDWGSEAFWIKEIEDLKTQARVIAQGDPQFWNKSLA